MVDKAAVMGVHVQGKDELSPVLKHLESGIIRFVGAVSSALTAISVTGFPVKAAAEFQKALIEVRKTTDFSNESMGKLREGVIELSKETDVAANELARIASLGGKMGLGMEGPQALVTFTEELARAVTALDVNAEKAANAMGKLINIFQIPMTSFRNAIAVINQLSNTSTASGDEIMDIMRRMGDLGGTVTYAQSAALAALAVDLGTTAETAGTSLTKIFGRMQSDAEKFASFMGMSTSEWVGMVEEDGIKALQAFLSQLNRIPAELAASYRLSLVGGGRISTLIAKLQDQMRQGSGSRMAFLLREANDEWERGTSAVREQQNVLTGLIAQWQIFKNVASAIIVQGGDQALVPLVRALQSVGDALRDESTVAGFERFVARVITAIETIVTGVTTLFSSMAIGSVDWATLFDIAGLLVVMKMLQTIPYIANLARLAMASALSTPALSGGAAAGAGGVAAFSAVQTRVNSLASSVVRLSAVETERMTSFIRGSQVVQAAQNKEAQIAQLKITRAAKLIENDRLMAAAKERLADATIRASNSEMQLARAEVTRLTHSRGGIQTSYGARIARETEIAAALTSKLEAQTLASTSRMSTAWAMVTAKITLMRNAMANAMGIAVPFGASLGFVGNAAVLASIGVNLMARAVTLLRRAFNLAFAALSKFFFVLILFDMVKMVLQWLGVWDTFLGILDIVVDKVNSLISALNKIPGVNIPTITTREEKAEAQRQEEALKRQLELRNDIYSAAEAYERQFGDVEIDFTANPEQYFAALEEMKKRHEDFRKSIEEGLEYKAGAQQSPATVFLDGVRGIRLMSAQLEALDQQVQDFYTRIDRDRTTLAPQLDRLVDLEALQSSRDLTKEEREEMEKLEQVRARHHENYLINMARIREAQNKQRIVQEEQNSVMMSLLRALDQAAYEEWFGGDAGIASGLISELISAGNLVEELDKKFQDMTGRLRAQGEDVSDPQVVSLRFRDEYIGMDKDLEEARRSLGALKQEFYATATAQNIARGEAEKFLDQILAMDRSGYILTAMHQAITDTGVELRDVMQGLANIDIGSQNQANLAAQFLYARQAVEAYSQWGRAVAVASDQAKNAIAQFAAKSRRDLEGLHKFFLDIDASMRKVAQDMAQAPRDEEADKRAGDRIFELELREKKEKEILKLKYDQYEIDYETFLRGERQIEQKYEKEKKLIKETAEYSKSADRRSTLVEDFREAEKEGNRLKALLDDINKKIRSDQTPQGEKDSLIAEQQRVASLLDGTLDSMKGKLSELAKMPAIGGAFIVREEDIAPLKSAIQTLQEASAATRQEGLVAISNQINTLLASVDEGSGTAIAQLNTSVIELRRIAKETGQSTEQIIAGIVALSEDPRIAPALAAFRERVTQGVTDFSVVRFDKDSFQKEMDGLSDLVLAALPEGIPVGVTINKDSSTAMQAAFVEMAKDFKIEIDFTKSKVEQISAPTVGADVEFDDKQAQDAATNLKPVKVKAELDYGKGTGPLTTTEKSTISGHAAGGFIRGPGTSISDSILSWLSRGEYVMDALTVRMFGPGFFQFLQKIAKGGTNIKDYMPSFSDGGMLSRMTTRPVLAGAGPSIIQQYFETGGGSAEEMFLNLSFNDQPKARVKGSREQIRGFVDALQELKRAR